MPNWRVGNSRDCHTGFVAVAQQKAAPAVIASALRVAVHLDWRLALPINIGSGATAPAPWPTSLTSTSPWSPSTTTALCTSTRTLTTSSSTGRPWTRMPVGDGASAATSTSSGMELLKDSYIPIFSNKPQDYREWRQRILLYKRKLDLQNKGKEAVLNVPTSLHGVAWKQIEGHVDTILGKDEGSFDLLIKHLDGMFKYNEDVEMPRAFERFFYGTTRRPEQTLLSYVSEHKEALAEVEKHGVQIADKVNGWILLRRSGLTSEQKQLIMTQCPKLSYDKVVENLFYLFGQDYKTKASAYQDLSRWKGRRLPSQSGSSRWSKSYAYMTEEPYDQEENYEDDHGWDETEDAYYEEEEYEDENEDAAYAANDHEDMDFPDESWNEDPSLEEAYASYLDARRHFAQPRCGPHRWRISSCWISAASTTQRRRKRTWKRKDKRKIKEQEPASKGQCQIELMPPDAGNASKWDIGLSTAPMRDLQSRALQVQMPQAQWSELRLTLPWWSVTSQHQLRREPRLWAKLVGLVCKMEEHLLWSVAIVFWWKSLTTWRTKACPLTDSSLHQPTSCLALVVTPTVKLTGRWGCQCTSKVDMDTLSASLSRAIRPSWSEDQSWRPSTSRLTTRTTRSP